MGIQTRLSAVPNENKEECDQPLGPQKLRVCVGEGQETLHSVNHLCKPFVHSIVFTGCVLFTVLWEALFKGISVMCLLLRKKGREGRRERGRKKEEGNFVRLNPGLVLG